MSIREGLPPEIVDRRARDRRFVDGCIIPREPVLDTGDAKARVLMDDGPDEVHRMVVSRRIPKRMASGAGWDFAR